METLIGNGVLGNWFFYIGPVFALLSVIFWKNKRIVFAIPALIIVLLVMNPLAKEKFEQVTETGYYWRLLWIVPIIPLCAAFPAMLAEKIRNEHFKAIVAVAFAAGFMLTGSFTYDQRLCRFFIPANEEKIEQPFIDIADQLLEYDDHPYVVADWWPSIFLRQYSPKLRMLYGRDIMGEGRRSALGDQVDSWLRNGDYADVAAAMLDNGYEYYVSDDGPEGKKELLSEAGFEYLSSVEGYGIYRVHGTPSQRTERNQLGQIISVTCLDTDGNPTTGDQGYAVIHYEYDDNGYLAREFRTDLAGIGVEDSNGMAGYLRKYDSRGHVISETTIGRDGRPKSNAQKYAEHRIEYKGRYISKEAYYDENGDPVNHWELLYSSVEYDRDKSGNLTSERYYNAEGNATNNTCEYASVKREYAGKRVTKESYFDPEGRPALIPAGYSSVGKKYNSHGDVISETYFAEANQMVNTVNGYARIERVYDELNRLTEQSFYDSEDHLVVVYTGYAKMRRTYDDDDQVILEEYFDADNEPLQQAAGHVAIRQAYDEEKNLRSRTYLDKDGEVIVRTDGYCEAQWIREDGKAATEVRLLDDKGENLLANHLNLATNLQFGTDGWSQWMIPRMNIVNSTFNIGTVNLGDKQEGDAYTSQIEVEFKNVSASEGREFHFRTQGAQDRRWFTGNIWNGGLISLSEVPSDGVYSFVTTQTVSKEMESVSTFNIGFRCDNWGSGMFRVRHVKIEKGDIATEWDPGV